MYLQFSANTKFANPAEKTPIKILALAKVLSRSSKHKLDAVIL